MAKKKSGGARTVAKRNVSKQQTEDDKMFFRRAQELILEGNKHFSKGRLEHARQAYEKALQLSEGHAEETVMLHSNLGAILLLQHNFEDAVKECTLALEIDPYHVRARQRRARSFELTGALLPALADIRFLLKVSSSKGMDIPPASFLEMHNRLCEQLRSKADTLKPAIPTPPNGAVGQAEASGEGKAPHRPLSVKLQLGSDVRVLGPTEPDVSYAQLRALALDKFTSLSHFLIKYTDSEGDLVTVTSRDDVRRAVALQSASASPGAEVAVRFVVEAAKEGEVPPAPAGEMEEVRVMPSLTSEADPPAQKAAPEEKAEEEVYELDDWMIDFAELFKEQLGIDPDAPLDLSKEAWEKCAEALDASVQHDKAESLLRQAAGKFEEVVMNGLLNLGNVHMCVARKYVDVKPGEAGSPGAVLRADEALSAAEKAYREALGRKETYVDAVLALGQVQFERGKVSSALKVEDEASKFHASKAEGYFRSSIDLFKKSHGMLPEEQREKQQEPAAGGEPQVESNVVAQALVMWGNALYELSQCHASASAEASDWSATLQEAIVKFKEAKCRPEEVESALQMHCKSSEINKDELMELFGGRSAPAQEEAS